MENKDENKPVKKADGRKNNGGHSTKGRAGRPPKITEKKLRNFAVSAIKKAYGSEEKMWLEVAKQAKESFPHMKMLLEFTYGKPKEQKEVNVKTDVNIPIINFLEQEKTIDVTAEEVKDKEDKDESSSTEPKV